MVFIVYVDDVPLFSSSESSLDTVTSHFQNQFQITVSKTIKKFLGFTVADNGDLLKLHNGPMM